VLITAATRHNEGQRMPGRVPSPRGARGCRGPGAPEPFVGRQYVGSATSSWTYPGPCDSSPRLQTPARGGSRVSGHPVRAAIRPLRGPISPVQLLTAEPMTKRASGRRGARCRLQPPTGRQIVLSSAPPARVSALRSRRKRVVCAQRVLRRAQIALGVVRPCSDLPSGVGSSWADPRPAAFRCMLLPPRRALGGAGGAFLSRALR